MDTATGQLAAIPDRAEAGSLLGTALGVISSVEGIYERRARFEQEVRDAYERLREEALRAELSREPLDRLRAVSGTRLRLGVLERAGIRTIADVLGSTVGQLSSLSGVGPVTAQESLAAAAQIADVTREHVRPRVDAESAPREAWPTVRALQRCIALDDALSGRSEGLRTLAGRLAGETESLRTLSGLVRRLLAGSSRRADAAAAAARVQDLIERAAYAGDLRALDAAEAVVAAGVPARRTVLDDFERRAAPYLTLLELLVGSGPDAQAAHGFLPEEEVSRIGRQRLDTSLLRTNLRVYQAFGARFALQRGRAVLGDEMGTGKTLQAIAAMAHLAATGRSHFLVICPGTVLVNWEREIATHSALVPHTVHGTARADALRAWIDRGGIAVTTFETARRLDVPESVRVGMLVVDEAHYVKNPETQRSKLVRAWTERVERVLFLSGTPMENRPDEFRNLVGYLRDDVARQVTGLAGAGGAKAFRRAVAPVYLRRNQEDVLPELPEQIQIDDWVEFGGTERSAYRQAVLARAFGPMRQAAYTADEPARCAKPLRLREIVRESCEDGRKVVVFSFYRDVLDLARRDLEEHLAQRAIAAGVFGPLNGSVPVHARQSLVDAFTTAPAPAVLIAQIDIGGTGLNLQAASVVVLCEPQLKPSTEQQAIARAHRMGQVRRVTVHRLLATESVDERLLEMLERKEALFDEYARQSETADRYAAEAKDATAGALESALLNLERHRVDAWVDG